MKLVILILSLFSFTSFAADNLVVNENKKILVQAENILNSLTVLSANFEQSSSQSENMSGKFYMQKPGKMRLEYKQGSPLIIVDGKNLIYVDKKLEQTSYIPLGSTSASIMLKDKISFFDDAVKVLEVKSSKDMNEVSVTSNKEPGLGQITFKFKSNKFIGWRTVDAMGIETEINLSNAKNEQTLDASLFRYDKPKNYSSEEKIDF